MKLIKFNFTKIDLEKKSDNFKNLRIETGIDLLEIKEITSPLFNSQEAILAIKFKYTLDYEKDIALLNFSGNALISTERNQAKEALERWNEKKLPEEFRLALFSIIFRKSSIKALQFEEELNLPPHLPLPSFKRAEKK
jgi:hypothetical protein